MIKRVLTPVNAMHIAASVFLSLRSGQASTTTRAACITITRCGSKSLLLTRPSTRPARRPVAQPNRRGRLSRTDRTADAHLKRNATPSVARDGPRGGGCRDRGPSRFWHLGADLLRGTRRAAAEEGAGQDHGGGCIHNLVLKSCTKPRRTMS